MSKYGTRPWRRVLALTLVFLMTLSTLGSSGYTVFAEDVINGAAEATAKPETDHSEEVFEPSQETAESTTPEAVDNQPQAPPETPAADVDQTTEQETSNAPEQGADVAVSEDGESKTDAEPKSDAELVETENEGTAGENSGEPTDLVEGETLVDKASHDATDESKQVPEDGTEVDLATVAEPVEAAEDGEEPAEGPAEVVEPVEATNEGETPTEEITTPAEPVEGSLVSEILQELANAQTAEEQPAVVEEPVEGAEELDPEALPEEGEAPLIDPETGFAIDPETGYLIDPETGAFIDPETGLPVEEVVEELEVQMPAVELEERVEGTRVTVTAPEGAFPEGVSMTVKIVDEEEYRDAIEVLLNAPVAKMRAVDITFFDIDSNKIEPKADITVEINASGYTADMSRELVHIDDYSGEPEVVDADTSEKVIEFTSDKFSVYVVVATEVPRLTVTFKNGSTDIATMYVKAADTAAEVEDIIYDPGAGTVPAGQVFKGWTTVENYTAETQLMTIAQVRSDAMNRAAALNGADGSVTYYAAIFKQFNITYVDGGGITVGTDIKEIPNRDSSVSYTVNMPYATDSTHDLEGWIPINGSDNIAGYPGNAEETTIEGETVYYYPNEAELTISGNITFAVDAPEGHWLIFDENGKGGTYNAPRFIKSGDVTSDEGLLDMVRNGYEFAGWYTGAPSTTGGDPTGSQFQFGGTLNDTTTIYAKWTPITNAKYTVIIWKQNVTGTGYDFAEAISLNGPVNATINTVTQDGSNVNTGTTPTQTRNVKVDGEEKSYTGFHCARFDTGKTIVPEGSTVLNVYYDRNTITINFDAGNNRYILDEKDDTYKRRVTYTGLYEAPLSFTWPTTYYSQHWSYWEGTYYESEGNTLWQYGNTTLSFIGSFKLPTPTNVSISLTRASAGSYPRRFIQQNADGTWPDTAHETINMSSTGFTITDKYTGFYAYQYRRHTSSTTSTTGWEAWTNLDGPDSSGDYTTVSNAYQLEVRFARIKAKISYLDGAYVDGNNNPTETPTYNEIDQSAEMYFGADVSSYGKGQTNYFTPPATVNGYVFEGWYADKNCTQEYTFTTMPAEGITVYAKWRQIQYRVFLHPNAGTDPTLNWGSETQDMNFRVSYGGKISAPTGLRTGYEFFGWYTDEGCTKPFAAGTVLNESTVTTPYDKTTHMTEPMDKWGNGATTNGDVNRFWITKEYNLYAKWSAVIVGADGIGITYDVNGGSNPPSDTALYKDNSDVSTGAAPTPPANKVFDHWVLQTWNGSAYVDTDTTVLPGETFAALKKDAKITDAESGNVVAPTAVVETGKYNYTIQLKAVYKDKEEETPTHIDWYSNYGSENDGKGELYHSDTNIKINEAVNILGAQTRTGYTFKGWTKTKGGTTADFLVWTGSGYTTVGGTEATQVAADEKQPYEDLFAVWEENQVTINYAVASDSTDMGTVSPTSETVKVDTGEATGSTATAVSDTYVFDYWTVDDGTEPISTEASFTPDKNSSGLYEAATYYAHFKLNKATVTVHHYLKGTTTKVADDVTSQEAINSQYTAQPMTKYQTLDLTVDDYNPSQTVTVSADGNVITIYYTLPLTITANTTSKTYDGTPLGGTYEISGELSTDTETITGIVGAAPSITHVADGPKTYQATTNGIPEYYTITNTPGTLTINPATLTVTTPSDSREYNGEPLTAAGSVSGYKNGETADFETTGTITEVGSVTNSYTIIFKGEEGASETATAVRSDYTISESVGTLTITQNETELKIVSETKSFEYDGTTHTYPIYNVTYGVEEEAITKPAIESEDGTYVCVLPTGDKVTITPAATAAITHVAETTVDNAFTYVVDHQNQYKTINTEVGKLSVTPATLTVTTPSDHYRIQG